MGMIIINGEEYASAPKNGFPPLVYSDEEREVGVWRDGKPLYQKTLIVPKNIGTGNNVQYAHNIPNIDRVVGFEYGGMLSNGGIYRITYDATYRVWVHEINRTMVLWALGSSIIQYLDSLFVTMQYTKTTDVPGSGKYTTYGGLSHHYSENEQVVGTWVDGKPLYEKTIQKTFSTSDREGNTSYYHGNVDISSDIPNLKHGFVVIDASYYGTWPNERGFTFGYIEPDGSSSGATLMLGTLFERVNFTGYITIRYTKTTD